ncbi:unnamed protein product [Soboliphyme baturini]|uniref:Anaphase-promoting complex subunit 1 n=1 Tax=Soboliphyme baturini TaxID=241478 RepID=A0A183J6Y4_9BILA|nr:unnamed protein product [Soboliphyme baturini]
MLFYTLTFCSIIGRNRCSEMTLRRMIQGKNGWLQRSLASLGYSIPCNPETWHRDDLERVLNLLKSFKEYLYSVVPGVSLMLIEYVLCLSGDEERLSDVKLSFDFPVAKQANYRKLSYDANRKNIVHDGMHETLNNEFIKARFPGDQRLHEVRRMLCSSEPILVALKRAVGMNDQEFREDQERFLYSACLRMMTCPIARGMFTMKSSKPLVGQRVHIPELNFAGKTPQNLPIDLSHIEVASNIRTWPQFHNGVAAALMACSNADTDRELSSTWISYNLPRLAGFVLGLGLNGHLKNLALFNIHEYLAKGDAMLSCAMLIGVAASRRGTADVTAFKMLATHLPFLLPSSLLELNIDPLVQTAAVIGAGLLFAESSNSRLSEAMIREIDRPASVNNDCFVDKEAYALSCGLALGFINLGKGNSKFASSWINLHTLYPECKIFTSYEFKLCHDQMRIILQSIWRYFYSPFTFLESCIMRLAGLMMVSSSFSESCPLRCNFFAHTVTSQTHVCSVTHLLMFLFLVIPNVLFPCCLV